MPASQPKPIICPLCHEKNDCKVATNQPCWCFNTKVPTLLLEQLPKHLRHKACICRRCIDKFSHHQEN